MGLKALTVMQPWASLIARGIKTMEVRNWNVTYRGPLVIHAGTNVPAATRHELQWAEEDYPGAYPLGCVVALADLVDCRRPGQPDDARLSMMDAPGEELRPEEHWLWCLNNIRPCEPIRTKGALRLWEIDPELVRPIPVDGAPAAAPPRSAPPAQALQPGVAVVASLGITREEGCFYFIEGTSVYRKEIEDQGQEKGKAKAAARKQIVAKNCFKRERGYFYFVDGAGDVKRMPRSEMDAMLQGSPQGKEAPAPDAGLLLVESARTLFDSILPATLAQHADKACQLGGIYVFKIDGPSGGVWTIDLSGDTPSIAREARDDADHVLHVHSSLFKKITQARLISIRIGLLEGLRSIGQLRSQDPDIVDRIELLLSLPEKIATGDFDACFEEGDSAQTPAVADEEAEDRDQPAS